MDEKKGFFGALKESRKKQVLVFFVSMVILIGIYLFAMRQLYERFEIIEDNFSWVYQVDSIEEIDGKLQIKGWAFALGENAQQENCEIILYNTKTGKGVYPKMTYEPREDVNEYFLCEYDYTESGFKASVSAKSLQLEDNVYEILLRPKSEKSKGNPFSTNTTEERKAFSTNVYYSDGEMLYVHPDEFVPLEVTGTDLEKVVEQGVLRVYRPDYGMYVYQYEGELYWIAELDYGFVDGDTIVQYQMQTTQIENLPEERLINSWFWNNLVFRFSTKELLKWDTGEYRVAKYALPTEYSLTKIWTGNHIDKWIWRTDFRPWYEFSDTNVE